MALKYVAGRWAEPGGKEGSWAVGSWTLQDGYGLKGGFTFVK